MKYRVFFVLVSLVVLPVRVESYLSSDGFVSVISSFVTWARDMASRWLNNLAIRADWKEAPKAHFIFIDVPGLQKEELKIEVEDNGVLRVSGERKIERKKKGDEWHMIERGGKFFREFLLPSNADLDSVSAKLEDGVLAVFFRKLSPDKMKGPKKVNVNPSRGDDDQRYHPVEL